MKVIAPKTELRVVYSLLEGPSEVQVALLDGLSEEHFGHAPMHTAYTAIETMLLSSSVELPTMETFLQSPDLDQDTVDILTTPTVSPIQKVDDAKRALEYLEYYRGVRTFYQYARDSLKEMKSARKRVDLESLVASTERVLSDMKADPHEERLYDVGKGAEDPNELVREVFSKKKPRLVPSSFRGFDSKTGGFGAQDFVVLASHKKGGKSITALNMTIDMYQKSCQDVIYIPLEMSKQETAERLLSRLAQVEHSKIRRKTLSPIEWDEMKKAWRRFKKHGRAKGCRFTVWPIANLTTTQLRIRLRPFGYTVIVIDYLNLLVDQQNNPNEWQRLGNFARELKLMTKELGALIIAPTQMNEDGTIRYARGIAEHANTVWTWSYGEEEKATHRIVIDQPAVRNWSPFKFELEEDFERMTIKDPRTLDDFDTAMSSTMDSMI